jgi:hypothetical protein
MEDIEKTIQKMDKELDRFFAVVAVGAALVAILIIYLLLKLSQSHDI